MGSSTCIKQYLLEALTGQHRDPNTAGLVPMNSPARTVPGYSRYQVWPDRPTASAPTGNLSGRQSRRLSSDLLNQNLHSNQIPNFKRAHDSLKSMGLGNYCQFGGRFPQSSSEDLSCSSFLLMTHMRILKSPHQIPSDTNREGNIQLHKPPVEESRLDSRSYEKIQATRDFTKEKKKAHLNE